MKSKFVKYKILLVLFSLLLSTNISFGKEEKPEPPDDFSVTPHIANFGLFKWKMHQHAGISGFIIYYHIGNSEETSEFEILDTVSATDPNLKLENGYHSIFLHVAKGEYSFFITAFNQFGESDPSNIVFQTMGENEVKIHFTTRADTIGFVGEEYKYEARAEASTGAIIKYKMKTGPQGMDIEPNSGKLSWTPKEEGRYLVIIHAYLLLNPKIFFPQDWNIIVKKCKKESIISGTIKYQNGEIVESGIVKIYKKSQQTEPDLYSTIEFTNGVFSKEVDEGIYYLRFDGEKIIPEWYEDVYILAEAKPVQVKCGEEKKVDAVVDKYIPIEYYKISGKVTRESDGAPVPNAPIQFFGRNNQSEENKKSTTTNQEGYYEKTLQGNYNYIVAFPTWGNYLPQFYNKVDNPLDATILELNSNIGHLDFVLKDKPAFPNSITGLVVNEEGYGLSDVSVIAYKVEDKPGFNKGIISRPAVKTDNGGFKFENLIPGNYILLVNTKNTRKIPGYYKSNNSVIRKWKDATKIEVSESGNVRNIIIKVPNLSNQGSGNGVINGIITEGDSYYVDSLLVNKGDPITGAVIFALDQNKIVRNFDFTGGSGRYEMKSLKSGKYTIITDKVGYITNDKEVVLADDNSTVGNNVELYKIHVDVTDFSDKNIFIYPNPVENDLNISVEGMNTKLNMIVYNNLGIMMSYNSFFVNGTKSNFQINLSNLSTGFYYLKIENGLNSGLYPFVISR